MPARLKKHQNTVWKSARARRAKQHDTLTGAPRFARRAQQFLRGMAWRKDLRPEESSGMGGPISMQYSGVSRGVLAWKGSCKDLPSKSVPTVGSFKKHQGVIEAVPMHVAEKSLAASNAVALDPSVLAVVHVPR